MVAQKTKPLTSLDSLEFSLKYECKEAAGYYHSWY